MTAGEGRAQALALGRRYLPFLIVVLVQVLLAALVPSRGIDRESAGALTEPTDNTDVIAGGASATPTAGPTTGPESAGTTDSANTPSAPTTAQGGDRSRCTPDGKTKGPAGVLMPPCIPVFHGTNGGASMTGVTAKEVRFVVYAYPGSELASALLSQTGYSMTLGEQCRGWESWTKFANKYFETHGRKLVSLDGPGANKGSAQQNDCSFPYFAGKCNQAPPDHPCYRAEAAVIASMKPAFVIAQPTHSFVDELLKRDIIVLGGGLYPKVYYDRAKPKLYGITMDSDRAAELTAEYYCKQLNAKPAIYAGNDVKSTRNWGNGKVPTRKLAILHMSDPGDPSFRETADRYISLLTGGKCKSPGGVLRLTYVPDVSTAQQQSANIAQQMIQNRITTLICICDFVSPIFWTQGMTAQQYEPEHFLGAIAGLDQDVIVRLYDQTQWRHAFGVAQLAEPVLPDQSEAAKVFRDTGCTTCNFKWPAQILDFNFFPFKVMGMALQFAGPSPTSERIHAGLMTVPYLSDWAKTHDPHFVKAGLDKESPFTFYKDVRLVYWRTDKNSSGDGRRGTYCSVEKGRRFIPGGFATGNPTFFDAAKNGC